MWKTDEFQVTDLPPRRPQQINQVQPLQNFRQPPLPAPVAPPVPYAHPAPYAAQCPRCGNQGIPRFAKKISPAGWIVFAALMVVFFPLFWIGLLIKEDIKVCGFCNYRLG